MKRKDYEKPAMLVVELPHRTQLLQMSGRKNYIPDDNDPFGNQND